MCRFIVVLCRRRDFSPEAFREYFLRSHEPLASALPHLVGYVQHFAQEDPTRPPPSWDAVIELSFPDRHAMESAWQSEAGRSATDDLARFADLERSSWSIVDTRLVRVPSETSR
jgi:uncharacterized protein (TIGR02118 family)